MADKEQPTKRQIAKAMNHASKLPVNIKVTTAFISKIDAKVKRLFRYILADYRHRFKIKYINTPMSVVIMGIDPENSPSGYLGVTIEGDERMLVQIEDHRIRDEDEKTHFWVETKFIENLCHELVHVCQNLTDPECKRRWCYIAHNKKDEEEAYFFNRFEIEARILEQFYRDKYGINIFMSGRKDIEITK